MIDKCGLKKSEVYKDTYQNVKKEICKEIHLGHVSLLQHNVFQVQ